MDDLHNLQRWLRERDDVGNTVLMPLVEGQKQPLWPHKDRPWTWAQVDMHMKEYPNYSDWAVLLDGICVVDADSKEAVDWLEALDVPELRHCPLALTTKGRHYFFRRPSWADDEGFYDGAKQIRDDVDLKTRCRSKNKEDVHTRGVVVISPTKGKRWMPGRAPWDENVIFVDIPRVLMEKVAKARPLGSGVVAPNVHSSPSCNIAACNDPTPSFKIREILECLSQSRWEDRTKWLHVGTALKNIGGEHFEVFDEFSRRSAKYDRQECKKLWDTVCSKDYDGRPLSMASLLLWAKEDTTMLKKTELEEDAKTMACFNVLAHMKNPTEGIEVVDTVAEPDHVLWKYNKSDSSEERSLRLQLDNLRVTIDDGHGSDNVDRFLHESEAIPVGVDISSIHKDIRSDQEWKVTRPKDSTAIFTSPDARVQLINIDRPIAQQTAKVVWPSNSKTAQTSGQRALKTLNDAYSSAITNALTGTLGMGWAINMVNGQQIINVNHYNNDPQSEGKRRTADFLFLPVLREVGLLSDMVALSEKEVYVCREGPEGFIWRLGTLNIAAEHIRRSAAAGALKERLESVDASYVMSCDGPVKILKSMISEIMDDRFPERLNRVPDGCLCFNNGMYDCATGDLRPYQREDYISRTIGYDYVPYEDVPVEHHDFIADFYAKVFPVAAEGEYYKRMMARALLSRKQGKYFLVLTDERDGNNGKTTLMRGTERAFGVLKAKTERDFLYESSHTSNSSACPNMLEYVGKKLACFDEPSSDGGHKRMDLQKIKELTSGEAFITARANYGNAMLQADWECLIVIACNEANFPKINAADRPFVARMKALKMRGLFVSQAELSAMQADEEEHVFVRDDVSCYKDLMQTNRMAHMHAFLGAYARMTVEGGELGPEPDCVKEMVDKITMASDPRLPKAKQWIAYHIDFAPLRTPDMLGKKYYAWLAEKDVLNEFWNWYNNDDDTSEFKLNIGFEANKKSAWKMVLKAVMKELGRTVKEIKPFVDGKQVVVVAYDKVMWMKL
jgi:hypothetical protein